MSRDLQEEYRQAVENEEFELALELWYLIDERRRDAEQRESLNRALLSLNIMPESLLTIRSQRYVS